MQLLLPLPLLTRLMRRLLPLWCPQAGATASKPSTPRCWRVLCAAAWIHLAAAAAEGALVLPPCGHSATRGARRLRRCASLLLVVFATLWLCTPRADGVWCGAGGTEGSLAAWHGSSDGDGALSALPVPLR